MLFLECYSRPFPVFKIFKWKSKNSTPSPGGHLAFEKKKKVVKKVVFFFYVWGGKNQSLKFMSFNLRICKVRMEIYLEIKNAVLLVWSVKSVGLHNVNVIKIGRKYCQLWLTENQCRQLSNVPVFLLGSHFNFSYL